MSTTYTIHILEAKYDPDHDTMPGLPQMTWGDYQLLQLIKDLEYRLAQLEDVKSSESVGLDTFIERQADANRLKGK